MAVGKPIEGSRAKPSVIVDICQIKAVRHTAIDCASSTSRRKQSYSSPLTQIPQPRVQQISVQTLRHNE
eukprot:2781701-Prymnesium_polylepis.1